MMLRVGVPLRIPDLSMIGPTGERDNLIRLVMVLTALLPRGIIIDCGIEHDVECPCVCGVLPITDCLCKTVNVTLTAIKGSNAENN